MLSLILIWANIQDMYSLSHATESNMWRTFRVDPKQSILYSTVTTLLQQYKLIQYFPWWANGPYSPMWALAAIHPRRDDRYFQYSRIGIWGKGPQARTGLEQLFRAIYAHQNLML